MKISLAVTSLSLCLGLLVLVQQVSAQACDVAGCINGECLRPPLVPAPICNCTTGFSIREDPLVCEDTDECSTDYFKCGITVADRSYYADGYPTWPGYPPFWPLVPAGRCVNTPGTYRCLCHPPFIPIRSYKFCARRPQNGNNNTSLRSTLTLLRLLNA